jgi:hypothetical protein
MGIYDGLKGSVCGWEFSGIYQIKLHNTRYILVSTTKGNHGGKKESHSSKNHISQDNKNTH